MGFQINTEDGEDENAREMWTSLGALSSVLRQRGLKRPFCFLQKSAMSEVLSDLGERDGTCSPYTETVGSFSGRLKSRV